MLWPKPVFWPKKTQQVLLHQQPQNAVFFFLPLCPYYVHVCCFFFLSHKHPDFKCLFCTFCVSPEGSHADNGQCTEALPCACHLSNSCCCFSSPILEGHLFIFGAYFKEQLRLLTDFYEIPWHRSSFRPSKTFTAVILILILPEHLQWNILRVHHSF